MNSRSLHFACALLYGRAHTRPCLVLRGRKFGYASVGMTLLFGMAVSSWSSKGNYLLTVVTGGFFQSRRA